MITKDQWNALVEYVTKRLEEEEKFTLNERTLERMFEITHPFWEQMCEFARESELTFTGRKHWLTSDGEPTEIEYARQR